MSHTTSTSERRLTIRSFQIRDLTKKGHYENITFDVRRGDILGLAGLLGAGRRELALSLFGLNPPDSGEILFEGKPVVIDSPATAKDLGIGFLPEDRYTQGLFLSKDVMQNVSSAILITSAASRK